MRLPICPACGQPHAPPDPGETCPLTGGNARSGGAASPADPRHARERAALFRQTHDEWLALTVSYVQDEVDLACYAAAYRRLAALPGPGGPARWLPAEADLLEAALAEVERRRAEGRTVAAGRGEAYGAGAAFLQHLRGRTAGDALLVRARRCRRCGAPKRTLSRTAFLHCDFCATWFDYDLDVASRAAAVDPRYGWLSIMSGYRDGLREAREAGDRKRSAQLWREHYTYYTLLCYPACSPRIRDPAYRRALIDGYLVTIAVAKSFDARFRDAAREVDRAEGAIVRDTGGRVVLGSLQELLGAFDRMLDAEADLAERTGAFAAHPDGLDRELFVHVNHAELARRFLFELPAGDALAVARRLGRPDDLLVPFPDGVVRGCGVCGGGVPVVAGARHVLCERCGRVLDVEARALACPACGAPVALAVGARAGRCGHCEVVLEAL